MGSILRCQIDPYRDRKEGPTLPSPPRDRARAEGGGEAHLSRPRNQTWRSVSHSLHAGLHTHTSGPFREESSPRGSHAMQCNAMDYAERCSDAVLPLRTVSDCNGFAMTASNAGCPLFEGKVRDPNPSQVPSGSSDSSHHTNLLVRSDYNGWAWRIGWDGETLRSHGNQSRT